MNAAMHALSLYLDTSVIGGYYDAEFLADTRALWLLKETGRFRFVSSQLVINEIAGAPERVRALMQASFAVLRCFPMGRGAQDKPNELRSTKAGLPLMSFAKGRNFRLALRLIVFGVDSGESAHRRRGWTCLR